MPEAGDVAAVGLFRPVADGLVLRVRLTPRASAAAIGGIRREAGGQAVLKAAVTAAPTDGKANAALLALLAKAWGIPKTSLSVVAGATDRRKTVLLAGDPAILMARLADWEASIHG